MSVLSRLYEKQIAYSMGISLTSLTGVVGLYPKLQRSGGGKQHHGPPKVGRQLEGRILSYRGDVIAPRFVKVQSANPFTIWPLSPVTGTRSPIDCEPNFRLFGTRLHN